MNEYLSEDLSPIEAEETATKLDTEPQYINYPTDTDIPTAAPVFDLVKAEPVTEVISVEAANTMGDPDYLKGKDGEHFTLRQKVVAAVAAAVLATGIGVVVATHAEPKPVAVQHNPDIRPGGEAEHYYPKHTVTTTMYGVGEGPRKSNGYKKVVEYAWESGPDPKTGQPIAVALFGGKDDPYKRNPDGTPQGFEPLRNLWHVGIPKDEFDRHGPVPGAREESPWADEAKQMYGDDESLFKGRWVMVEYEGKVAYGQWYDTGIIDHGDAADEDYVFGPEGEEPKNKVEFKVSHTMAHYFGKNADDKDFRVTWKFVDARDVPDGPWKDAPPIDNLTYWND